VWEKKELPARRSFDIENPRKKKDSMSTSREGGGHVGVHPKKKKGNSLISLRLGHRTRVLYQRKIHRGGSAGVGEKSALEKKNHLGLSANRELKRGFFWTGASKIIKQEKAFQSSHFWEGRVKYLVWPSPCRSETKKKKKTSVWQVRERRDPSRKDECLKGRDSLCRVPVKRDH